MPPPDRMLTTLRRAVGYVSATPGRVGHLLRLPSDTADVIVAGDMHGHIENFKTVFQYADLGHNPHRHLVLQELVHGPFQYPTGGDKSHQLVDLFAALKCQYPERVHYIPGNHEHAQWTGRAVGKADDLDLNESFRRGVETAYGTAWPEIMAAYNELFKGCPQAIRVPNRVFLSHSLPASRYLPTFDASKLELETYPESDFQPGGFVYTLVWGRDTAETTVTEFLQKVDADLLVTGHIKTDLGHEVPNSRQLIVDCASRPAGFVRFPADRAITHTELVSGVVTI